MTVPPFGDRRSSESISADPEDTAVLIVDYRHHDHEVTVFEDANDAYPWTVIDASIDASIDDVEKQDFSSATDAFRYLATLVERLENASRTHSRDRDRNVSRY